MASNCARRLFQRSTASARSIMSRNGTVKSPPSPSVAPRQSNLGGLAPSNPAPPSRFSRRHSLFFSTRLPVELSGGESLMPLHSASASALLRSMLSAKVSQWGCLSEGKQCFSLLSSCPSLVLPNASLLCLCSFRNSSIIWNLNILVLILSVHVNLSSYQTYCLLIMSLGLFQLYTLNWEEPCNLPKSGSSLLCKKSVAWKF